MIINAYYNSVVGIRHQMGRRIALGWLRSDFVALAGSGAPVFMTCALWSDGASGRLEDFPLQCSDGSGVLDPTVVSST